MGVPVDTTLVSSTFKWCRINYDLSFLHQPFFWSNLRYYLTKIKFIKDWCYRVKLWLAPCEIPLLGKKIFLGKSLIRADLPLLNTPSFLYCRLVWFTISTEIRLPRLSSISVSFKSVLETDRKIHKWNEFTKPQKREGGEAYQIHFFFIQATSL